MAHHTNSIVSCKISENFIYAEHDKTQCRGEDGFSPESTSVTLTTLDYRSPEGDLEFSRTYRSSERNEFSPTTVRRALPRVLTLPYSEPGSDELKIGRFEVMDRWLPESDLGQPRCWPSMTKTAPTSNSTSTRHWQGVITRLPRHGVAVGGPDAGQGWVVKNAAGSLYRLDAANRVVEKTSPTGRTSYFDYDGNGRPKTKRNQAGRSLQLEYDSQGALSKLTDDNGHAITYHYAGDLIQQVEYPDGATTLKGVRRDAASGVLNAHLLLRAQVGQRRSVGRW